MGLREFLQPAGDACMTQALAVQRAQVRLARFNDAVQRLPPSETCHKLKRHLDGCDAARRFVLASYPEFHRYVKACEAGDNPAADLEQPLLWIASRHHWDEVPAMPARLVDDRPSFKNPFDDGNRSLSLDDEQRKTLQAEVFRALAFIKNLAPDAVQEMAWTATYLSPIAPNADNKGIPSFSSQEFPGVIFVGLLRSDGQMTDWRHLVELIFHEHLHNRLYLLDELLPMIQVDASRSEAFYSPWKNVSRPLDASLHSLYVFSHLAWFWASVLRSPADAGMSRFAEARGREHLLSLSRVDAASIHGAQDLTDCGRSVVEASLNAKRWAEKKVIEWTATHAA